MKVFAKAGIMQEPIPEKNIALKHNLRRLLS